MPLIILHMSKLATGLQRNCRSYVFLHKQALKYQNIIKIKEMKNKLITFLAIAGILFVSCSNTSKKSVEDDSVQSAQPVTNEKAKPILPALKLIAADGSNINLADFKGKKVFVNLWATWCPPCKAEIPSIEKLYSKVNNENTVFVMLSLDDNFEIAKNYAKDNKMKLPVYYPAENLPGMFNTGGIPATFIFNEYGELIKMSNGMDDYDTKEYVQLLKSGM